MKKVVFFTVVFTMIAGTAMAHDVMGRLGLGFVTSDAPIGFRYHFSEKVGLDVGVGFDSNQVDVGGGEKERFTDFTVAGSLPINIQNVADRVNFNFLPGVMFMSLDQGDDTDTLIRVLAALEFEVFVTSDFSVGASQGIAIDLFSPGADGAESTTDFSSFGRNVTEFGFHYYLPQ